MTAALLADPLPWTDLARYAAALKEATDLADLLERAARAAARLGADLLALARVEDVGATPRLALRAGVFPPEWRSAWEAQDPALDRLAQIALNVDGPFALNALASSGDERGPPVLTGTAFPYRRPLGGEVDLVLVAGAALGQGAEAEAQHRLLADAFRAGVSARLTSDRAQPQLTLRQRACLRAAQHGRSSRQIGADLRLAPKTVDIYLAAAAARLGVRTRTAAVSTAMRLGLL